MSKRKQRLLITLLILVPLLVIIALWAFYDMPPPDDADLRVTYEDIPDDENAFIDFQRAAECLSLPKDQSERMLRERLLEGGWDETAARRIIAENERSLELVLRGTECSRSQAPSSGPYAPERHHYARWRDIARLAAVKTRLLFEQGREQDAFDLALETVRFGQRLEEGKGPLLGYTVGHVAKVYGLKEMRRMLARTTLESASLLRYMSELQSCGASEEGLENAFRAEYRDVVRMMDVLRRGGFEALFTREVDRWVHYAFLKPNRTKRLFASRFRGFIADIPRPYSRMASARRPSQGDSLFIFAALASGNGKGLYFYVQMSPTYDGWHARKCLENCSVRATRILIALKCYKLDHDELPDTLDALVPDYLDAVPLDDFDGKPMKYSKEKKVVHAVGTDLVDNGGVAGNDFEDVPPGDGYDLVYKIRF